MFGTTAGNAQVNHSLWDLSALPLGAKSVVNRIPECPGVYCFLRKIEISSRQPPAEFSSAVCQLVGSELAARRSGTMRPSYEVELTTRGNLAAAKQDLLAQFCRRDGVREFLGGILEVATFLQAPLYVGYTNCLPTRISTHLKTASPLRSRLERAGISLESSLLLTFETDELLLSDEEADSLANVAEDIISQICRPGFTIRYG